MSDFLTQQKQLLRQQFQTLRESVSPTDQSKYSQVICQKVYDLPTIQKAKKIAIYLPIKHEVNIAALIEELLHEQKEIYLPWYENEEVTWYSLTDLEKTITQLPFSSLQKVSAYLNQAPTLLLPPLLDAILVPGIVFDQFGYRIGSGKGIYDRILAQPLGSVKKIGVCFKCQLTSRLPIEEYDQQLDLVITEDGTFFV
jgi:5-formyltetrahydrofolate cyclo-ligase